MSSPPIRDAVVVTADADRERRVAGVPLLLRTVLTLQRAGIERCTVVGPATIPQDPRIRCRLTAAPALAPVSDPAPCIVVGAGTIIDETLVRDLQGRVHDGEVLSFEHDGARVRVAPGPRLLENGVRAVPPPAGTLEPASRAPATVVRMLLHRLENPRDGYLDRLISRRCSRLLTPLLLPTSLTPNAVTVIGTLLGVAGGLALGIPGDLGVVLAVLGLLASGVLDCSDGELARLRFSESRLGHALDVTGDTFVHIGLLVGITIRLFEEGVVPGRPVLTALGLGVLGAFAVMTLCEVTEARRHRTGNAARFENRIIDGVLSPLTTRDWYVFPLAFALIGRLDWLLPAASAGAHVFWITALVLLVRVLRRS